MTGILDAHQKDNCSREYMYITCILAVNIFPMSVSRKLHDPGNAFLGYIWWIFESYSKIIQKSEKNEENQLFF